MRTCLRPGRPSKRSARRYRTGWPTPRVDVARRVRLDSELVRRGLARSRGQAGDLIAAGRVLVDGTRAAKAATQVQPAQALRVLPPPQDAAPEYASRAKIGRAHV